MPVQDRSCSTLRTVCWSLGEQDWTEGFATIGVKGQMAGIGSQISIHVNCCDSLVTKEG